MSYRVIEPLVIQEIGFFRTEEHTVLTRCYGRPPNSEIADSYPYGRLIPVVIRRKHAPNRRSHDEGAALDEDSLELQNGSLGFINNEGYFGQEISAFFFG